MQFNMKQRITDGLKGDYEGLSNGLDRINDYLFGIQRACYYLVGGLSGASKTTFLDYMLLNAIADAEKKGIKINITYYSWEINEETKKANWLSVLVYRKYGIIIPPEKIKGYGKYRLDEEEQKLVYAELDELNSIFNKIEWFWQPQNPTGMYKHWWDTMSKKGTFIKEAYLGENNEQKERIKGFTLTDSKEYNIVAVDHIAYVRTENGLDLKRSMDKLSEYCVMCRNLFSMTFINLQQFNSGLNSVDRQKFKGVDISPQQSDFRDSTNTYNDCDIALGLMNAFKMDMNTCLGYNISGNTIYNLKDSFRMLKIIKNRLSRDNIVIGLLFLPKIGSFKELPESSKMTGVEWQDWLNDNLK